MLRRARPYLECEFFKRLTLEQRVAQLRAITALGYRARRIVSDSDRHGDEVHEGNLMEWRHFNVFCTPATGFLTPLQHAHGVGAFPLPWKGRGGKGVGDRPRRRAPHFASRDQRFSRVATFSWVARRPLARQTASGQSTVLPVRMRTATRMASWAWA